MQLIARWRNRWRQWFRAASGQQFPVTLTRRHIYIVPTRYGWLFGLMLLCMLFGSINYTLSLGFVLTFLLAGLGNMAMLHTWRNLVNLRLTALPPAPVFCGNPARLEVVLQNPDARPRTAIHAEFDLEIAPDASPQSTVLETEPVSLADQTNGRAVVMLPTSQRGWMCLPRVRLYTEFPLLLFHAWAYLDLRQNPEFRVLVYPSPSLTSLPLPIHSDPAEQGSATVRYGDEDFAGHRSYQFGDSPRRIDWKASSREQGLLTKQFQGQGQDKVWLDWYDLSGLDPEARIRQLTRWVVDSQQAQSQYGLRLPGLEIAPNYEETHYRQCLQALALWQGST